MRSLYTTRAYRATTEESWLVPFHLISIGVPPIFRRNGKCIVGVLVWSTSKVTPSRKAMLAFLYSLVLPLTTVTRSDIEILWPLC